MKIIKPYGSWKSPVTSDLSVAGTISLADIALDGDDVYWIESRPTEGGRYVIVRLGQDAKAAELTPQGFNARTTVHEYGGGASIVDRGAIYFSNFADQRLYRQAPGESPQPITPSGKMRYADGVVDRSRDRIYCVREDLTAGGRDAVYTLVSLNQLGGHAGVVMASGNT